MLPRDPRDPRVRNQWRLQSLRRGATRVGGLELGLVRGFGHGISIGIGRRGFRGRVGAGAGNGTTGAGTGICTGPGTELQPPGRAGDCRPVGST
jgi:hypothetical protein